MLTSAKNRKISQNISLLLHSMYLRHHPNYCKNLEATVLDHLLKSKDCDSNNKTNEPFYFIKYTMKIRKFFCNAKTLKKTFPM